MRQSEQWSTWAEAARQLQPQSRREALLWARLEDKDGWKHGVTEGRRAATPRIK
ncbi:hypothetical protein PA598K_02198 [Paenibacillus sp. 598K]|uniref:hypothetical protein n=1 Tax=Paenibacillus sp. 598K TaxID=1117987 RepID=UPI000FF9F95D|nr:hypothetical protein [Paenibacillus sp. 598K]GBF73874.1 hypothetical protein PA598K_02198 [Paenibacillus sp. 598K]